MARYELVLPSDATRIRELHAAGKSLPDICKLSRRSRWTVRRILTNRHPACALPPNNSATPETTQRPLAPDSSQIADSIAPTIQVVSKLEDGSMIVTREIVVEKFFEQVVPHFPLGRARPKEKFLAGLAAALIVDRVTEPVIEQAAFLAMSNHKGPLFPPVAICRQYCVEARAVLRSTAARELTSSASGEICSTPDSDGSETDSDEETRQ